MAAICGLVVIFIILLAALALMLIGILTDWWYRIDTDGYYNINTTVQQNYNFHYGLWRRCYNSIPADFTPNQREAMDGKCQIIYKDMLQKSEEQLDYYNRLHLHLLRTVTGCAIAAAAVQLFVILSLLLGIWPGRCDPVKRSYLYLGTSLALLVATMCGITSGICFIADRDVEKKALKTIPYFVQEHYEWSFMVHWISTGLTLVDSFLLLFLLKNTYDVVNEDTWKWSYYAHEA